jgi:aryl-alcohol dehydrogenase-like predicted oxidoreductase
MGRCLEAIRDEFPRESYQLITKAGKYGFNTDFVNYNRDTTLASVERSLKRLKTDYLDIVCESSLSVDRQTAARAFREGSDDKICTM